MGTTVKVSQHCYTNNLWRWLQQFLGDGGIVFPDKFKLSPWRISYQSLLAVILVLYLSSKAGRQIPPWPQLKVCSRSWHTINGETNGKYGPASWDREYKGWYPSNAFFFNPQKYIILRCKVREVYVWMYLQLIQFCKGISTGNKDIGWYFALTRYQYWINSTTTGHKGARALVPCVILACAQSQCWKSSWISHYRYVRQDQYQPHGLSSTFVQDIALKDRWRAKDREVPTSEGVTISWGPHSAV